MVVKNVVMVLVLCVCIVVFVFLKTSEKVAVASSWRGLATHWSHQGNTPTNKNTVNFDGRFHDGPNEPPAWNSHRSG